MRAALASQPYALDARRKRVLRARRLTDGLRKRAV
jgi:hypothetical protein